MRWWRLVFAVLMLAGCAAVEEEPLPPLATIEVPEIETRTIPRPKPKPASLVGQDDAAIRAALGNPAIVRSEPPAEVWRYGDGACGLLLFFYPEAGTMRVKHVEARLNGAGPESPAECLHLLRRQAEDTGE